MKYLVNNFDKEIEFDNLEEAKNYYKPTEEELEDDTSIEFLEYAQEIEEAKSLEELARILTSKTDEFYNGSSFSVKEI